MEYIDNPIFHEPNAEEKIFKIKIPFCSGNLLTTEEEKALFLQYNYAKMMDQHALFLEIREKLITYNVRIVHKAFAMLRRSHKDRDDIIEAGMMSLLNSVNRFDCSRGVKFITFSLMPAQKAMLRQIGKMRKVLANEVSLVAAYKEVTNNDVKLNANIEALKDIIEKNRANLTSRELNIISWRWLSGMKVTLREVGLRLNLTKRGVLNIEEAIFAKLRNSMVTINE